MKTILLTQNQVALVSDEDFEYLSGFNWYAHIQSKDRTSYAQRGIPLSEQRVESKRTSISMHRAIAERMGLDLTNYIDHIDGDGINNQRENLRSVTHQQNMQNQTRQRKGQASRYKGVVWHKPNQKWVAKITINCVSTHLGYFVNEIDAAMTYNEAAVKNFGEFASLNKIGYLEPQILDLTSEDIYQQKISAQIRNEKIHSSRYKGVTWHKRCKKWQVYITINQKSIYLGLFADETLAALAYNEAATKHFGDFAALNIILEQQIS